MSSYVRAIVLLFTLLSSGGDRSVGCSGPRLFSDAGGKVGANRSGIVQAPALPPSPATPLVLDLRDGDIDEEEDPDLDGRSFFMLSVDLSWDRPMVSRVGGDMAFAWNARVVATIAFAIRC